MNSTPESQKQNIQSEIPSHLLPDISDSQEAINIDETQPNMPRKVLVIGGIVEEPYRFAKVNNQHNINSPRPDKK